MRKLLTSPGNMSLDDVENHLYQQALKSITEISLNLLAVKVDNRPDNFLGWCKELHRICKSDLNLELLEPEQFKPLKRLQETLELGISRTQIKMMRISPWPVFAQFVNDVTAIQSLDERLKLLSYAKEIQKTSLAELIEEDRLVLAGKHTAKHEPSLFPFDVEWFGSTKGARTFIQLLSDFPDAFDNALAFIPAEGDVSQSMYTNFVSAYKAIFAEHANGENAPLYPATRLLAMKRPDQFVSLSSHKIDAICQGLGISKLKTTDFDAYWQELVLTLRTCHFWQSECPEAADEEVSVEQLVWQNRAILVDVFLFADESQAENSNFVRMRDKPKSTKIGVARSTKRSKESAEQLVDKALSADDVPEFLHSMRGTIIKSVQDGKSVEQAISLMKSIFG